MVACRLNLLWTSSFLTRNKLQCSFQVLFLADRGARLIRDVEVEVTQDPQKERKVLRQIESLFFVILPPALHMNVLGQMEYKVQVVDSLRTAAVHSCSVTAKQRNSRTATSSDTKGQPCKVCTVCG